MKPALPKVAHPVLGKPMLWHVARSASAAGIPEIVFVLGNGRDQGMGAGTQDGGKGAVRGRPLGTGAAARAGLSVVSRRAREVVVLCGDAPLLRPKTLRDLGAARRKT